MRKPSLKLILRIGVLLVLAAACLITAASFGNKLLSQSAAERWAGESDVEFTQLSCFMPPSNSLDINGIYSFRQKLEEKLIEAMPDAESVSGLYTDCWSGKGKLTLEGDRGSGEVSVITVGGSFFDFHPIDLLSGSYISERDVMKDRILLDEETAWMLFGGTDLAGMTVTVGEVPFLVAGVISREDDFASSKAYSDGPGIYMSYEAYLTVDENASILNYELVMADPVKGFAKSTFEELFNQDDSELVENAGRFSFLNGLKNVKEFGSRSMHSTNVAYPYWENAARYIEDWCSLLNFAAAVFLIMPAVILIIYLVRLILLARDKIKEKAPGMVRKAVDRAQDKLYSRKYAHSGSRGSRKGKQHGKRDA